jgi:hypothetical protein
VAAYDAAFQSAMMKDMQNNIALASAILLCFVIAGVKSVRFQPSELESVPGAHSSGRLESLLKLQQVLQSNLLVLNMLLLLLLAVADLGIFQVLALAFVGLVMVHMLANADRLKRRSKRYALRHLDSLLAVAKALRPALNLLDDTRFIITTKRKPFTSRTELLDAVENSAGFLSVSERQQIRAVIEASPAPMPALLPASETE